MLREELKSAEEISSFSSYIKNLISQFTTTIQTVIGVNRSNTIVIRETRPSELQV